MSHQSDLPPHVPSCVSTGAGVTVPDATATPRTDANTGKAIAGHYGPSDSTDLYACPGGPFVHADFARTLERELTSAKAEIARLNSHEGDLVIGCAIVEGARRQEARAVDRLEADSAALRAEVEQLRAQLRERTQWQCKCGGTDCAGMAENERLRAEVEAMRSVYLKGCDCAPDEACAFAVERDQLRARVAKLESQLSASATKAAAEYGEQLKPLFAKVRELEADKARLDWLEKSFNDDPIAKVPTWFSVFCDVAQEGPHPAPGQSLRAAIDAARAGKGAT